MTTPKRIQIVGRIPAELSRRVRALAKRRKVSLNTLLIEALMNVTNVEKKGD